jgi:hypothetical protein
MRRQSLLVDRIQLLEGRLTAATQVIDRCKGLIGAEATIKLWNTGLKPVHEWLDEAMAEARSPFLTAQEQADGAI